MIQWDDVVYFDPLTDKFSEDPTEFAEPNLIYSLDAFRGISHHPIHPSPVPGALARFDINSSSSRHYAVGRLSDAIDIFCEENIANAWLKAVSCGLFGGVGVYFDTHYRDRSWPMLHLDLRPLKNGTITLWYRDKTGYHYPRMESSQTMKMFRKLLDYS